MGKESQEVAENRFLKVVDYFLKTPKADEPAKPKSGRKAKKPASKRQPGKAAK